MLVLEQEEKKEKEEEEEGTAQHTKVRRFPAMISQVGICHSST